MRRGRPFAAWPMGAPQASQVDSWPGAGKPTVPVEPEIIIVRPGEERC
jgi:hypothetical protein